MKITIPFYTRDDFEAITRLLPNSDWPLTYEDWFAKTKTGENGVKKSGNVPVRINVKPTAFKAWCESSNQPVERNSILAYCAFVFASGIIEARNN